MRKLKELEILKFIFMLLGKHTNVKRQCDNIN